MSDPKDNTMTITKRDNSTVAHLWANQSRPEWRSANGNFSFRGATIKSYYTPIASRRPEGCVLITSRSFSATTSSKHMPAVRQALGYRDEGVFWVPNVEPSHERDHRENEANYREELAALLKKATKTARHVNRPLHLERAARLHAAWVAYCAAFGRPTPPPWSVPEAVVAALQAAETAARLGYNAERAERERLEAIRTAAVLAEEAERLDAWTRGAGAMPHARRGVGIRLRVSPTDPNTLETSWGAAVPLTDATLAFRKAAACRAASSPWHASASCGLRLGDYRLDAVEADGTIRAGCHTIAWTEAERLALSLGILQAAQHHTAD